MVLYREKCIFNIYSESFGPILTKLGMPHKRAKTDKLRKTSNIFFSETQMPRA